MFGLFNGVVRPYNMMPVFWRYWMYYVNPSTYWIGGVLSATLTGIPVQCQESETAIFDAEVTTTEESSAELAADAEDAKGTLTLLGRTLPIVLGLLGLVLIVVGLVLQRGRREPRHEVQY